jgi:Cu-processing system permease protein
MSIKRRDIFILTSAEFKQTLRGAGGVLSMCFLYLPGAWLVSKLFGNAEMLNDLAAGNFSQNEMILVELVKYLTDIEQDFLGPLFVDHSPFITLMFLLTAFAIPFLTMIAALDQNATDIGNKGIRFLLPRTSRDNLLLGRFLGTLLFWGLALLVASCAVTVVALVLDDAHTTGVILLDGLWFFVGLFLVALPFIAFMAFCAVTTGSPMLSVTMGLGSYLGVVLVGGLSGLMHESLRIILYVFPAPLRYDLVLGSTSDVVVAIVAMLGYTLVYLFFAGWILRKRDL